MRNKQLLRQYVFNIEKTFFENFCIDKTQKIIRFDLNKINDGERLFSVSIENKSFEKN